jgi:hypothetical protein
MPDIPPNQRTVNYELTPKQRKTTKTKNTFFTLKGLVAQSMLSTLHYSFRSPRRGSDRITTNRSIGAAMNWWLTLLERAHSIVFFL